MSEVHRLRARRIGLDTHDESIVYMPATCHVCRSEGFRAHSRVAIDTGSKVVEARLHVADADLVPDGWAAFSDAAWRRLGIRSGDTVEVRHAAALGSFSAVRAKMFGRSLGPEGFRGVLGDVVAGRYDDAHLAAFLTATGMQADPAETLALAQAMVEVGDQLVWHRDVVMDKHCIGGLPGNRTTPIVVAVGVAAGLCIPKTSSRAITSPAGTADTMEVITNVDLSLEQMRHVVEKTGGCLAWGGAVRLSPADDILIRIERSLDLDAPNQLVASVLSKKKAAGSTHVVIDMPVGPTAKLRSVEAAQGLERLMQATATGLGLTLDVVRSDGTQPVGRGIGPCLEARDVLAVLGQEDGLPGDLMERSLSLAAHMLELGQVCAPGAGEAQARRLLESGAALDSFRAICQAQGAFRQPGQARHRSEVASPRAGTVQGFDNRGLARLAKLAGAPDAAAAGLDLHVHVGDVVRRGDALMTLHAEHEGALAYALDYLEAEGLPMQVVP